MSANERLDHGAIDTCGRWRPGRSIGGGDDLLAATKAPKRNRNAHNDCATVSPCRRHLDRCRLRRANHTLPEELRFVSAAEGKAENKAAKQIQTKDKSRRECRQWLSGLMSDSNIEPLTKEQIWKIAKTKWPDSLSEREFVRCRDGVIFDLSDEQRYLWKGLGPRSKRK